MLKGCAMKIIGLTRVRNEEKIILDTLNHWAEICTGGIYVYDDKSVDKTPAICKAHPAVKGVIEGKEWDMDRERAEFMNRQEVLTLAQKNAGSDDWFVYFDADERLFFEDWHLLFNPHVKAIACKLFDIYITPEDTDYLYTLRDWVGPEYRTIVFFFRNSIHLSYDTPDQRVVNLEPGIRIPVAGYVKHYGKGLSVQHWEETCDYYINFFPKYSAKWAARKGKAVKVDYMSDFGNPLIRWKDREAKGFPLENQIYGRN